YPLKAHDVMVAAVGEGSANSSSSSGNGGSSGGSTTGALGPPHPRLHEQQQQHQVSLRSMVWQAVLLVAQLETQQKEWGVADKDTRALARQGQAKIKQAHQLVDQLALWEVLGTTQHPNQVRVTSSQLRSMVRGEPAPWEGESQTSQEGKVLFFGRQFFHLLSDSQRCLEQLALLKVERARLNAW
ncbi:hypothetical protein QJQ45_021915, partial [Haematococcus lacustris]